jgi:hypothetical protein
MMLGHIITICELALCGILLWYVIGKLDMPPNMILVARGLLVLILVLYSISVAMAAPPPPSDYPMVPIPKGPASIMGK